MEQKSGKDATYHHSENLSTLDDQTLLSGASNSEQLRAFGRCAPLDISESA